MKKIFNYIIVSLALVAFASCSEDIDSNPILQSPDTFVLNEPAAATNNVYDLENSSTLSLTCSQPAYGFPASTVYTVDITLDDSFTEDTDTTDANFQTLTTTYNTANLEVNATEINAAILKILKANGTEDHNQILKVNLRLKANIYQSEEGTCYSNAVTLPQVQCYEPIVSVSVPTELFLVGSMSNSNWSTWIPMNQVYGVNGMFFGITYFSADSNFKIGLEDSNWGTALDYTKITTINADATTLAGISDNTDDGHNIKVANAGWYTIVITCDIENDAVTYDLNMVAAEAYLIGPVNADLWEWSAAGAFTAPADDTSEWVSPAFTGSGEVRMSVKVPNEDWWRTEFTIKDGTDIYYRKENIPSNWATDLGANYSISGTVGNIIHANFLTGVGSVE